MIVNIAYVSFLNEFVDLERPSVVRVPDASGTFLHLSIDAEAAFETPLAPQLRW
jgi:hypothetical protein